MNENEIQDLKAEEKEAFQEYEFVEPIDYDTMDGRETAEPEPVAAAETHSAPRRSRKNNDWVGGVILIGLGLIFLMGSFNIQLFANWWALFILVPGILNLSNGLQARWEDGRFSHRARGSLMGGLFMSVIGAAFLFGISWSYIWPLFIIIVGIGALLNR